jgi:ABC-type nickel/cobalt efflux system permease component RcnA
MVCMTFLTIFVLFSDDIRIISVHKKFDDLFFGFAAVAFVIFAIEIGVSSYALPNYVGHFFFYLDIISTLSLIPDIGWIWDSLIENSYNTENATDFVKISRAGRTTRIIRVIRLVRLLRIVRLYKQAMIAQKQTGININKNKPNMLKGLDIKRPLELEFENECNHDHSHDHSSHDHSYDFSLEDFACESHHHHSHSCSGDEIESDDP